MECDDDKVFNPLTYIPVEKTSRLGVKIMAVLLTDLDLYEGCEEGFIIDPSLKKKPKCVSIYSTGGKLVKAVYDNKLAERDQIPIVQGSPGRALIRAKQPGPCTPSTYLVNKIPQPFGMKPGHGVNPKTGHPVRYSSRAGKEIYGDFNCLKYPRRPSNFKFKPLAHQTAVADYVEQNINNISGVLLNWSLGSGKTCGAISIADRLLDNPFKNIYVLTSGSLRENFLDQYCNVCGVDRDRISKKFTFITYNYNDILSRFPTSDAFNNSIIIIDEIQSFTSPLVNGSDIYTRMYHIMKAAINAFFILMSGTPVTMSINQMYYVLDFCNINYPNSVTEYRKLFLEKKGVFLPGGSILEDMSHVISRVDKDNLGSGKTKLVSNITELADFYDQRIIRASLPSPELKSPESLTKPFLNASFDESIDEETLDNLPPLEKPEVPIRILGLEFQNEINDLTQKLEELGLNVEEQERLNRLTSMVGKEEAEEEVESNEENPYPEVYEDVILAPLSDEQYDKFLEARDKELGVRPPDEDLKFIDPARYKLEKSLYYLAISMLRSRQLCNMIYPDDVNPTKKEPIDVSIADGGWIPNEVFENIGNYSAKFYIILEHLKATTGKVVIYSEFKTRYGIWFLSSLMKYYGYNYLLFTGDLGDEQRGDIINKFNAPENVNGDNYRIMLMTEAASQGQNFLAVRYLYIMEQSINEFDILQVKGRVVRYHSHILLPPDQRSVSIYRMYAVTPGPEVSPDNIDPSRQTSDMFAYTRGQARMKLVSGLNQALEVLPVVPS